MRLLLAALALSAAVPGVWASAAPRSFYADFPGLGRHWVAELPAYSEHLVRDVGAFYVAFAVLFAWAALRPSRALVVPLTAGWAVFSVLHLAFHAANTEGFATVDAVAQTASLVAVLAAAVAALLLTRRAPSG